MGESERRDRVCGARGDKLDADGETGVWSQTYGYDGYGNRWVSASSGVPVSVLAPTSSSSFSASTNRLTGSYAYDSRGNLTSYGSYTLVYDGDDRVLAAGGIAPSTGYEYDGEGRRVRAHVCSSTLTCAPGSGASTAVFVYDGLGRLVMEYGPEAVPSETRYYTRDHLGSTRLETDASGQAVKCSDYLPFGEEIPADYGSRSSCFNPNANRIKFTGKERDAETGLDYFGARYYSGAQGRFTGVDPVIVTPARMIDPQRFNLYAYARNNPFKFIDPNGEDIEFVNDTEEGRKKALGLITKNMRLKEAANVGIRQKKDGSYEAYIIDKNAIGKDASPGYKQVAGLINDHSIVADVGVIGGGLTATFKDLGPVSSYSEHSVVMEPAPGSKHVSVLVTQGDVPGGTQIWCNGGKGVCQGRQPDFVTMHHELLGETLKYRLGYEYLQNNPALDSKTVIKIENEIRQFHAMSPRTGADHGMTVITVRGKVQ